MNDIKLVYREPDKDDPRWQKALDLERDQWVVKWDTLLPGCPLGKEYKRSENGDYPHLEAACDNE